MLPKSLITTFNIYVSAVNSRFSDSVLKEQGEGDGGGGREREREEERDNLRIEI